MSRILTESDADQPIALSKDETFGMELEESPTTGYRWHLEPEDPDAIQVLASDFRPSGSGVGAAGRRSFQIKVTKAGDYHLKCLLQRAWDPANPVRSHTFRLHVG
jgi:predicted secreted protein